jgi:carbon-monoxide dehydrogenase medium subunit
MIVSIKIKKSSINKNGYFIKLGLREAMAIAVASVAVTLDIEKNKIKETRIAMGSVSSIPLRLFKIEEFLRNKKLNVHLIEKIEKMVCSQINPITDIRASKKYRYYISGILLKRAFTNLLH